MHLVQLGQQPRRGIRVGKGKKRNSETMRRQAWKHVKTCAGKCTGFTGQRISVAKQAASIRAEEGWGAKI